MMKIIRFKIVKLNNETKTAGLNGFKELGYFLVDSTYNPVNLIKDDNLRNIAIMEDFENLLSELDVLKAREKQIPIILVKANIFAFI